MKDAYRRRRKAERDVTKALPSIDPNPVLLPAHQERLASTGGCIWGLDVQENEFIATDNEHWRLALYSLNSDDDDDLSNDESISDISAILDCEIVPNENMNPSWRRIPTQEDKRNGVRFIVKDVIACTDPEIDGHFSTWCARSGQCLETATMRSAILQDAMCKISNAEFVIGSVEGHLIFVSHNNGCDIKETKRIWKAHQSSINYITIYEDTLVSTSKDYSARLWDSKSKKRLSILYHDDDVYNAGISNEYIITCSTRQEFRIYDNREGYPLVKMFLYENYVWAPRFLENGLLVFWMDDGRGQEHLVFFEIDSECVLAQLKVGCRDVCDYAFLSDGRLVAAGTGGCRGVIVTLPDYLRTLFIPENKKRETRAGRRRFCTVM